MARQVFRAPVRWIPIVQLLTSVPALLLFYRLGPAQPLPKRTDGGGTTPKFAQGATATGPTPQVRIEYLGTESGYISGQSDIVLLCVVRNVGGAALPEKTLRMHCLPVAGLDYTTGDTLPPLPALAPAQAVAFRWRLTPTGSRPSIAAVLVERISPSAPPPDANGPGSDMAMTVVPYFNNPPRFGAPINGADLAPQAGGSGDDAWVCSNRVALRLPTSDRSEPVLVLEGRNGANWQTVATCLPVARALTCEDGQSPWWQSFRRQHTATHADKDSATLTLIGTMGPCLHAEVELTARRDTGVIEGKLRLTARKNARVQAVQLPRLFAAPSNGNASSGTDPSHADGTPALLTFPPPMLPDDTNVAAAHIGGITYGLSWPKSPPLNDWVWSRLPVGDGAAVQVMGVQCASPTNSEMVPVGGTLIFPFRLFTLGSSDTVRDALHFAMP